MVTVTLGNWERRIILATLFFLLGAGLIFLGLWGRERTSRSTEPVLPSVTSPEWDEQKVVVVEAETEKEAGSILDQAVQTLTLILTELEKKEARLKETITLAEQRLQELQRAVKELESLSAVVESPPESYSAQPSPVLETATLLAAPRTASPATAASPTAEVPATAEAAPKVEVTAKGEAVTKGEVAAKVEATAVKASPPDPPRPAGRPPRLEKGYVFTDPWEVKLRQVHALAEQGEDVASIARQLELTRGEVHLLLGLSRRAPRRQRV